MQNGVFDETETGMALCQMGADEARPASNETMHNLLILSVVEVKA